MDRIKGWIWGASSKEETNSNKPIQENIATSNLIEKNKTEKEIKPSDKNNSSTEQLPIKPVLLDEDEHLPAKVYHTLKMQRDQTYNKFSTWVEANSELTPQDDLSGKLRTTALGTIMHSIAFVSVCHQRRTMPQSRVSLLVSLYSIIGMYGVFLKEEWYVALTEPPGVKPRSFFQSFVEFMGGGSK